MSKLIGVIGCGWLGLPLAVSLIKVGYTVHGSTTSEEKLNTLKQQGIIPFKIALSEDKITGDISNFLREVDTLIINVPPKLRGKYKENFVRKMHLLQQEVKESTVQKVVFVSSTSVYGDVDGEVTEDTVPQPSTESGRQLLASENIFFSDKNLQTTVIRFGGLIGPKRHPITILSGRQNLSNGNAPINLIHLDDCIRIIESVIMQSWWNEIINGVYPKHQKKEKYYTEIALEKNLKVPEYNIDDTQKGKIILSEVLLNVKKFNFTTTI